MGVIAAVLQIVGLVFLAVAGFLVSTWVGFAVAGVGCLVFGIALERS